MFDLEKGSTLYIDFAKANSRSKRSRTGAILALLLLAFFLFLLMVVILFSNLIIPWLSVSELDDERCGLDKKARVSPAFVFTDPGKDMIDCLL